MKSVDLEDKLYTDFRSLSQAEWRFATWCWSLSDYIPQSISDAMVTCIQVRRDLNELL